MAKFRSHHSAAAKLTPLQVKEIIEKWNSRRYSQAQLARDYNMSEVQIGRICRGVSWRSITAASSEDEDARHSEEQYKAGVGPTVELTEEEKARIVARLAETNRIVEDELGLKIKGDATEDYLAKRGSK